MVGNEDFSPIYLRLIVLRQLWRDNAPNNCTNSCNESSGRSAGIAASYFHLYNEIRVYIAIRGDNGAAVAVYINYSFSQPVQFYFQDEVVEYMTANSWK
jgi:hypothetical protein